MHRGEGRGSGWNGCGSLSRVLTLDAAGRLSQTPAAKLRQLRHAPESLPRTPLGGHQPADIRTAGNALEIVARLRPDSAAAGGLRLVAPGPRSTEIKFDGRILDVAGTRVPLQLATGAPLELHLFLDRCVLEVFIAGGREFVTCVVNPLPEDLAVEVFAYGGRAVVESLNLWALRAIW